MKRSETMPFPERAISEVNEIALDARMKCYRCNILIHRTVTNPQAAGVIEALKKAVTGE